MRWCSRSSVIWPPPDRRWHAVPSGGGSEGGGGAASVRRRAGAPCCPGRGACVWGSLWGSRVGCWGAPPPLHGRGFGGDHGADDGVGDVEAGLDAAPGGGVRRTVVV